MSDENRIVLHSNNQLVTYDTQLQQLFITSSYSCFACGQSIPHSQSYTDSNYFKLLSLLMIKSSSSSSSSQSNSHSNSHSNSQSNGSTSNDIPSNTNKFTLGNDDTHEFLSSKIFNQGYYEKFFRQIKQLGRGYRGSVYQCLHVLDNVSLGLYAVKKIPVGDDKEWLVRMLREVYTLEKVRHFNVIEYRHCWIEDTHLSNFGPFVPCLFILMELANGGNLEEYVLSKYSLKNTDTDHDTTRYTRMRKLSWNNRDGTDGADGNGGENESDGGLSLMEIWSFFIDIVSGLDHLHSHGILHRDLKASNLLLRYSSDSHSSSEIPRVLISDFGESESLFTNDAKVFQRTGHTGTLEFTAPELFKVDMHGNYHVEYSPSSDIWSLGMILYFLCFGKLPYSTLENLDILKQEIAGSSKVRDKLIEAEFNKKSNDLPLEIFRLLRIMLSLNPRDRPSAREILGTALSLRDFIEGFRGRGKGRMGFGGCGLNDDLNLRGGRRYLDAPPDSSSSVFTSTSTSNNISTIQPRKMKNTLIRGGESSTYNQNNSGNISGKTSVVFGEKYAGRYEVRINMIRMMYMGTKILMLLYGRYEYPNFLIAVLFVSLILADLFMYPSFPLTNNSRGYDYTYLF